MGLLISQFRYYDNLYLLKSYKSANFSFSKCDFQFIITHHNICIYNTNNDKSFYTENQSEYRIRNIF